MPLIADPGNPHENTLDYWDNRNVKCPHCDIKFNPGDKDRYELYSEGAHIADCPGCERSFRVTTDIRYSFSTDKQ